MDIREKLKKANGVTVDKKPNDKERIAQLEAENEELHLLLDEVTDGLIEIADIVGEKSDGQ